MSQLTEAKMICPQKKLKYLSFFNSYKNNNGKLFAYIFANYINKNLKRALFNLEVLIFISKESFIIKM